jgi:hypothetical protein
MREGFDEVSGPVDRWEPLARWQLKRGRVILYLDWDRHASDAGKDLMEALAAGARLIIATRGLLPAELNDFSVMTA